MTKIPAHGTNRQKESSLMPITTRQKEIIKLPSHRGDPVPETQKTSRKEPVKIPQEVITSTQRVVPLQKRTQEGAPYAVHIGEGCSLSSIPGRLCFGSYMENPHDSHLMPNGGIPQAYIKTMWNDVLYYIPVFTTVPC